MRKSIALRLAITSGLIAAALTSVGAVFVHVALFESQLDGSRATAAVQADDIQSQTVADVRLGGDYGPLPYELVTSGGTVVSASTAVQALGPGPVSDIPAADAESLVSVAGTAALPSTGTGALAGQTVATVSDTFSASLVRGSNPSDLPGGATPSDMYRVTVFVSPALAAQAVAVVDPFLVAAVPLAGLIVGAAAFSAVRRALVPVEQMRRAAARVSESPESPESPELAAGRRSDELSDLAETLAHMVSRLRRAVTVQRRFSADAAHELRSPLAALLTTLEVARAHPELVDRDETLAAAIEQTERLRDLSEELLSTAAARSAPRQATFYDIEALVREAVAASTSHGRAVTISVNVTASRRWGDEPGLERAVRNLVDNALRHASTRVEITGSVNDGGYAIQVCDDGAGVAEDQAEQIFLPFVRLDDARARDTGGAGLGLALAREVVEAQGGSLTLDTGSRLTTFIIQLPDTIHQGADRS